MMTEAAAIETARNLANTNAPAAEATQFWQTGLDGDESSAWDVVFWGSEADAENDDGSNAVSRVTFSEADPAASATVR